MKLAVVANNVDNILEYKKIGADAFIFGFKNYSSGYGNELTIDEIKKLRNEYSGELFIAVNKNFFNRELDSLEKMLIELDKIKVNGVLFYDLAVLSIAKRLSLSIPLIWNQTHMVTNYNTCNYYYENGCKYGVLSSEITLEEINEIKSKTKMKLFMNVFGYQIMGYTRRHLLDNYFKSIGKKRINNSCVIRNMDEDYIIDEEDNGNAIYYGKVLNGSVTVLNTQVDYLILNENKIEKDLFEKVLMLFKRLIDTKDEQYVREIDKLVGDNRGFFFKKTIYKVKKDG